ncbi:MAG: glucose-6-phosphate isomerase [Spirochaetaceae bacterium]|nr:glucose-6-phosphate isomerase [Spirochaetaceae bacterium]
MHQNLDQLTSFNQLKQSTKIHLKDVITPSRISGWQLEAGGGLTYNYAFKAINDNHLKLLSSLADEQQLIAKYHALLKGEVMNTGEKRLVLHHLTRGELLGPVSHEGKDLGAFYRSEQERIAEFAGQIHSGQLVGSTGKQFDTVVQIGIGGSDLGPRALYLALERASPKLMQAYFISNVDPDDAANIMAKLNLESTLFILVSKSGTTQETLANYQLVNKLAKEKAPTNYNPSKHIIAITSQSSPMANNPNYLNSFYIDDFIGGRYSSTSAVGGALLSLAFGSKVFAELLAGAHEADKLALQANPLQNAAMLDALIGLYERNVLGYAATAVLPYSEALSRFVAHLQQVDMESNGKTVNRFSQPISYATGPVIFGEPGTNGQHSFYQLLHQGSDIIPLQFVGFKHSQLGSDITYEGSSSQTKLKANLAAQIMAFALGHRNTDANKNFTGERPASLIYGDKLNAKALGALLAHFENKVMFQGFLWNLNSFDQEGVQLGKLLTNNLLAGKADENLTALAGLFL